MNNSHCNETCMVSCVVDDSDNDILMVLASQEAEHDLTMILDSQREIDEAEIDCLMIQASQQVKQDDLLMQASLQFEQQQSTPGSKQIYYSKMS